MRTRLRSKFTLFFIVCAALLAVGGTAMALTTDTSGNTSGTTAPSPTIQSDKADYVPGELVTLTGSGWQAGESVNIVVNDDVGQTWNRNVSVTADASGNIRDQFNLPDWFVATYTVTATGQQSGVATTSFTDGTVDITNAASTSATVGATYKLENIGTGDCATAPAANATNTKTVTLTGPGGALATKLGANKDDRIRITASAVTSGWKVGSYDVKDVSGPGSSPTTYTETLTPNASNVACYNALKANNSAVQLTANFQQTNTPPTISDIGNQTSTEDNAVSDVAFTVGDAQTAAADLNVSGSSNNTTLVPNSNITFGGSGANRTVTITPAPDKSGTATITVTVTDGAGTTATDTFTVTFAPVNDTPVANDGTETVAEGGGPITIDFGALVSDVETSDANLTYNITAPPAAQGSLSGTGSTRSFTPAANFNGTVTINYTVTDRGDPDNCGAVNSGCTAPKTSVQKTVTVTVTPVNSTPEANDGTETVAEDGGPITIDFGALVSDAETSDANLTYTIGSPNPSGSLSGTGSTRSFTPAANFNGTVTINYTVTDRGDPDNCGTPNNTCAAAKTSAQKTVTVTVTEVNDAPAGANDSKSTPENTPLVFAASDLLGNDSKGPTNESGQTLTVTDVGQAVNGTVSLSSGQITFTPTTNYNGAASFKYTVCDNGTTNGAPDPKCEVLTATVNVTVSPVNSTPEATDGTASMNEDAAPITIDFGALVSDVETSDANLTYNVNIAAADSAKGSLASVAGDPTKRTFDSANDFNGTVEILYTVTDRGDPDNCSASPCDAPKTSAQKKVTVTVNPVNDVPSFTKGADQTVLENAGVQTVTAWATSISKGPADESTQTLSFQVSNNNTPLFSAQPAISSDGTLTYTPATNAVGKATVTVSLKDSGGTDNGGVDTSAAQTFTINVNYKFDGFRSPVDKLPTWNTVKAGSSIPVKFSLSGDQGMNIFALNGAPVSAPSSAKINCDTGATDALEEVGTAGSSGLNYDSTIDQYNYLWKSEKAWGGTCRMLTVELKDGTIHQAKFQFTK